MPCYWLSIPVPCEVEDVLHPSFSFFVGRLKDLAKRKARDISKESLKMLNSSRKDLLDLPIISLVFLLEQMSCYFEGTISP